VNLDFKRNHIEKGKFSASLCEFRNKGTSSECDVINQIKKINFISSNDSCSQKIKIKILMTVK